MKSDLADISGFIPYSSHQAISELLRLFRGYIRGTVTEAEAHAGMFSIHCCFLAFDMTRDEIIEHLEYQEAPGVHTYCQCDCGAGSSRGGSFCPVCLRAAVKIKDNTIGDDE